MKIAVIGAGAMGCLYGAYLSKENNVTLIDSYKEQVDAINSDGVTIIENGTEINYKVNAVMNKTNIGIMDVIIIFVKSIHTLEALEDNSYIIGENTVVITLQNGAGNDRDIMNYVKKENIIIGTSKHNSVTICPGKIKHSGVGITTIGTVVPNSECINFIFDIFDKAGIQTEISNDIQRIIWSKLFVNISINTLTALLETKISFMIQDKYAWDFAKRIIYEAISVAEEDGTYFDRREVMEMVHKVCENAGEGYSSMYQDRKKKLRTEIDKLNGAIVEQAKLYGIPTPCNSLVVDLIHAVEGTYSYNN